MVRSYKIIFGIIFIYNYAIATEPEPLWEYGVGVGYIEFEHYPASDERKHYSVPFPTFQYRGDILRADDRDGAKAYLFTSESWNLEFSGNVTPAIEKNENTARKDMSPLLWGIQFGPKLVNKFNKSAELHFNFFQSFFTDFKYTKAQGQVFETSLHLYLEDWFFDNLPMTSELYKINKEKMISRLFLTARFSTKEYAAEFFEVSPANATPEREAYSAKGGFLGYDIAYYQAYHFKRSAIYAGFLNSFYQDSVNKNSPLHKSNQNLSFFAGITYTLGESEKTSTQESDIEGLFNKKGD